MNTLILALIHRNRKLPLRGDMVGVNMDFTPPDGSYKAHFYTEDVKEYTLNSTHKFFINGAVANSFTMGGKAGLYAEFMYDLVRATWVLTAHNMGSSGQAGFTPEVLIQQETDGSVNFNKTLGNNFAVMLTMPAKFNDPVGYAAGEEITVSVRQGPTGPFLVEWSLAWAHWDRKIPDFAIEPGGLNKVKAFLTQEIDADNPGAWETDVTPPASAIGYGVPSYVAKNLSTNVSYYVLRSPTKPSGMTEMQPGETLKILRNSLGIEAYGAVTEENGMGNYLISGAMANGKRAQLRTGLGIRSAFDRGVMAFGGTATSYPTVTVQDLILSGARETGGGSHTASGISLTAGYARVTLKNVKITDNENGILTGNYDPANPSPGNDYRGSLDIFDCEFIANAVGDFGFTHNIYFGHTTSVWSAIRTTFRDAFGGHNIKTRAADTVLNQVYAYNAIDGRELDCPNGGQIHATDCIFEHLITAAQNDCVRIGAETLDTTRPREYIFRNCHFVQGKNVGNAASFIWNEDPDTDVQCIDCTFAGVKGWPNTDANGMRGRVLVTFTGGAVGPRVPVGYFPVAVTPIAG